MSLRHPRRQESESPVPLWFWVDNPAILTGLSSPHSAPDLLPEGDDEGDGQPGGEAG